MGPYNKEYSILGSILGFPCFGKLLNPVILGPWYLLEESP